MTVKEVLGSLGSWSVGLTDRVPEEVRAKFGFFAHIAILRGDVNLSLHSDADLLRSARYVGVVRGIDMDEARELSGAGMVLWLGDEDEKGKVFEAKLTFANKTLAECVASILPAALTVGTVFAQPVPAQRFTGSFQFVTPRAALQQVCDAFGVEFRVNGNGTVDVGTQANLYTSIPDSIVVRRGAGIDMDTVAIGAQFQVQKSAVDYSTRVLLVGQTQENATFAVGGQDAPVVPYRDLFGNPVERTRMISESGTTSGTVAQRSQLHLNRYNRTTTALKVTADDYEIEGNFRVGDLTDVYDPDTGIVNATRERYFRGDILHPDLIRISEITWSITSGHTVAFRTQAGEWIDLTPWVVFETGTNEIVVGDLPRSLTSSTSNPVLDRSDSLPDKSIPAAPTGLTLATTSFVNPTGINGAQVFASWTPPTTNTDGTPLLDLDHYRVQWRPAFRAPLWNVSVTDVAQIDVPATVDLVYDVRVAAVDKVGNTSAYTAIVSITASKDLTAPNVPSDPAVTSYLGQLRIEWDGLTSTGGAMPPDLNRVDVHVSTSAGFTPSAATLIASLSTKGVAYATAPYGALRYVRLVAVDHTGNASAASGTVTGSTVKVNDGDVQAISVGRLTAGIMTADVTISGRFATALTGARTEVNALGLQKWDSANNLLVSITGTDVLLTGTYKTARTGRRIEMGSAGSLGELNFFAPDGRQATLRAYTEGTGLEAMQFGLVVPGENFLWNRINYNSDGWSNYRANKHDFYVASSSGFFVVRHTTNQGLTAAGTLMNLEVNDSFLASANSFSINSDQINLNADATVELHAGSNDTLLSVRPGAAVNTQGVHLVQFSPVISGSRYGGGWLFTQTSAGVNVELGALWFDRSFFMATRASAFNVSSSKETKNPIGAFDASALDLIDRLKPQRYRRKMPRGGQVKKEKRGDREIETVLPGTGPEPEPGPEEIGFYAEEVPAEFRTPDGEGVSLYPLVAVHSAGIKELRAELIALRDEVRKGKKP